MSDTKKENKKASQNSEVIVEKSDEMLDEKAEEVIDETVVENIEETAEDMTEETIEEPTAKKVEKKAEQKADESSSNEEFRKLPFIEKCKKDPIIPVSLLLAFIAVIVAAIYFMLPNAKTPSMGITLTDFIHDFNNGAVATSLMDSGADIGFRTPPYVDPDSKPSMIGDKAVITASRSYADFFAGPSKYFISAGIEGATRKNDNTLSYVRIWVQYSDLSEEADFNTVWMYFSNTLNALYPDLSVYEAMGLAMEKMGEFDGDARFYCRGDYCFRLVPVQKEDITYIVIDVVPKSAINDSQIRQTLEVNPDPNTLESVPDESAPAST
jgi:hypothetical protein